MCVFPDTVREICVMAYEDLRGRLGGSFGYKLNDSGKVTDRKTVFCKLCGKSFSYSGSTSSLQYHLKHVHPLQSVAESSVVNASSSQSNLNHFIVKPISSLKEAKLTNKIVKWIVKDSRPINIISDEGLKEVLREAVGSSSYNLPSRDVVTRRIEKLYDVERSKLLDKLKETEFVGLTGDFWTSIANQGYLGVSAHWIDSNWAFCSAALEVKHVVEKHSAANCTEEFEQVVSDWNLQSKVVAICTDNARNIVLGVENSKYDNVRCTAHTLQLSLNTAIENASIDKLLSKCRKMVGHFKHSPYLENQLCQKLKELNIPQCKLKQDIVTRWNSTCLMFESLLEAKEGIVAIMSTNPSNIIPLTEVEWEMTQKMYKCLKPCLEICDFLGGSKYVTASVVLPAITHLRVSLKITDTDPGYVTRFKTALLDDLTERVNAWPKIEMYQEATALDPRFKYLKCLPREARELVWNRISNKVVTTAQTEIKQNVKKRKLVFEEDDDDKREETAPLTPLATEVDVYRSLAELDDDFADPLLWWKTHSIQLPLLSSVAKKLLCVPATSVPCERVFSDAGNIVTKRRAALDPDHVNTLTCLKSWLKQY